LEDAGFTVEDRDRRVRGTGVRVSFVARDADGAMWWFDVAGPFTRYRGGLTRSDAVWRSLGRASALRRARAGVPLVLLTTQLPRRPSEGDTALRAAGPDTVFDVVDLLSVDGLERLARYAKGDLTGRPEPGFWTAAELARREEE
jgi:site-specific DNA-methyltransferase (adenine-specific)